MMASSIVRFSARRPRVYWHSEEMRAPLLVLYIVVGVGVFAMALIGPFVTARLFRSVGDQQLCAARDNRPRVVNPRGEEVGTRSLLECQGTVVVHRDDSVSCTDDRCPHDLPRGAWFSLHSSFVRCSTALGGDGCPSSEFDVPAPGGMRRRQRDL